ncbi:MAG: MAEBL protein [Bacteriophage sp.]|nr:MAG: MAEBL protein [Bacteriophage sp.]
MEIKQEEELKKVLTDSGLQLSDSEVIKQSYLPYFEQLAKIKEESQKINFENPTELDEKIARELRLKTVKVRTGSKDLKDERKRIHMLRANVEQDAWNLIKSGCELEEENFYQVEKKRELAEKRRKELLASERNEQMLPYAEFVDTKFMNLGEMDEEKFQNLLKGAKLQLEQKEAEAKRIAEEEAERKRLEAERIEAQRIENERLKKEAEEKEKALQEERKKAEEERLKQEAILEAERKKAEEVLEQQRKEAQAKLDAEKKKSEEEAKKQAELLAQQQAETNRLKEEAEKKAKAEADAKRLEEEKALADKLAKEEAQKKAELAPKKDKLTAWVDSINTDLPIGLEKDETALMLIDKLSKYKIWAKGIIELL